MNHVWEENHIAFSQEPRLEDSQVRNRESERLIDKYPDKRRFNIRRSKIRRWKNWAPLEDHKQKVKTRVRSQTWITNEKTTTSKNTETEHKEIFRWNCKSMPTRTKNKTWEDQPKNPGGKGRLKRYRDKTKQFRLNSTFQNNEKKFNQ